MAIDFSKPPKESEVYPAAHSFRIIAEAAEEGAVLRAASAALEAFEVLEPLAKGRASSGGRYVSLHVTVRLIDRAGHHRLDAALRAIPGVRILL